MINNPCNLPRDIRFLILQDFKPHELLSLYLVNKDCAKICRDENFWLRKLQKDYPSLHLKKYSYLSFLELYKRLARRIGQLAILDTKREYKQLPNEDIQVIDIPVITAVDTVNYLIRKQIKGDDITLIIDAQNQLRLVKQDKFFATLFSRYLYQIYPEKYDPLLLNIKDIYDSENYCMILTTSGNLYTIKTNQLTLPTEISPKHETKTIYALELITQNVREIGSAYGYLYYITKESELYLLWGTTIGDGDDKEEENENDIIPREFKYVSHVKSVCVDMDLIYYVNLDGDCFGIAGWGQYEILSLERKSKQIVVKDKMWFILYENGKMDIHDSQIWETVETTECDYIQLFTNYENRYGPVYVLDNKLDLYMIKTPYRTKVKHTALELVASNVLNMFDVTYLVCLPTMKDNSLSK